MGLQAVFATVADYGSTNLTAAFQDSNYSNFVLSASLSNAALAFVGVHESGSAPDEGFVYFDFATGTAELEESTILHGETNAMEHEPCGFLSDAKSAANFVGADTVLAVGNHPDCDKPFVERDCRVLKDSSHLARELLAGVSCFAFPHAPSGDEADVFASASGALDAIGPTAFDHEREAVVGVSEVLDGFLECSGLCHGALR